MNVARLSLLVFAGALLAACASTPKSELAPETPSYYSGYDQAYMAEVERRSARLGVQVRWINPPKAKKPRTDD